MSTPGNQDSKVTDLVSSVYQELRQVAAATMARLPAGSTLQPTALVHEAWLRLGGADQSDWQNQAHFVAAAAEAMRHILIDRARRRSAIRHGGGQQQVNIENLEMEIPIDMEDDERLLAINEAISRLALVHPEAAELVKLRCFVGLGTPEAGRVLGMSNTTAHRRWKFAKTWLYRDLRDTAAF